jgi:hypothetical protein
VRRAVLRVRPDETAERVRKELAWRQEGRKLLFTRVGVVRAWRRSCSCVEGWTTRRGELAEVFPRRSFARQPKSRARSGDPLNHATPTSTSSNNIRCTSSTRIYRPFKRLSNPIPFYVQCQRQCPDRTLPIGVAIGLLLHVRA